MKIKKIDNTTFGNVTKTRELVETVLMKNFKSEGINSVKTVMKDLYPGKKAIGGNGYQYYAGKIKNAVFTQYPELAKDIEKISSHIQNNPSITKPQLAEYVEPFIQKHGENIDIKI